MSLRAGSVVVVRAGVRARSVPDGPVNKGQQRVLGVIADDRPAVDVLAKLTHRPPINPIPKLIVSLPAQQYSSEEGLPGYGRGSVVWVRARARPEFGPEPGWSGLR
jgi:hypothetical protein